MSERSLRATALLALQRERQWVDAPDHPPATEGHLHTHRVECSIASDRVVFAEKPDLHDVGSTWITADAADLVTLEDAR